MSVRWVSKHQLLADLLPLAAGLSQKEPALRYRKSVDMTKKIKLMSCHPNSIDYLIQNLENIMNTYIYHK